MQCSLGRQQRGARVYCCRDEFDHCEHQMPHNTDTCPAAHSCSLISEQRHCILLAYTMSHLIYALPMTQHWKQSVLPCINCSTIKEISIWSRDVSVCSICNKKPCYCRRTARRATSAEICCAVTLTTPLL